jgi:hypothetical protein
MLYRLLLRAYPRAFREAYGPLLEQAFRDILRAEQAHASAPRQAGGATRAGKPPHAAEEQHTVPRQAGAATHAASGGSLLGLWWWTLGDLATSALIERTSTMRNDWKWLISLGLALAVGLGIGIVDTSPRWDDSGITAMAMLCASGVLGILYPRRPWVWALAIGVWIPILNILVAHNPSTIFALIFPFAGAYLGAFGRRLVTRAA